MLYTQIPQETRVSLNKFYAENGFLYAVFNFEQGRFIQGSGTELSLEYLFNRGFSQEIELVIPEDESVEDYVVDRKNSLVGYLSRFEGTLLSKDPLFLVYHSQEDLGKIPYLDQANMLKAVGKQPTNPNRTRDMFGRLIAEMRR